MQGTLTPHPTITSLKIYLLNSHDIAKVDTIMTLMGEKT